MAINITLSTLFFITFLAISIFYAVGTTYDYGDTSMVSRYGLIQDVHVMVFIGFAFLMSFLHTSGLTAVSHATLIAVLAVLWGILMRGFWHPILVGESLHPIHLNMGSILNGDFAAAACLISFGAVIGRVTAAQMIVMVLIEVILYAINEVILIYLMKIADVGGALFIHEFGCYFGLAMSWMLGRLHGHKEKDRSNNKATRMSDTYAMIGTLFLFCFWPSFTSVVAGPNDAGTQQRAFVNTFLGMAAAAFAAFGLMQLVYGGKFRMVEVQNSTLAAGVAFGVLADMNLRPFGAVVIGGFCGMISVLGYRYLQSFLEEKLHLIDTCGINNLHGMPALFGAFLACILAAKADQETYNNQLGEVFVAMVDDASTGFIARTGSQQAGYQLAAIFVTLAIAVSGGLLTGFIISLQSPLNVLYHDSEEFELEEEEEEHHAVEGKNNSGNTSPDKLTKKNLDEQEMTNKNNNNNNSCEATKVEVFEVDENQPEQTEPTTSGVNREPSMESAGSGNSMNHLLSSAVSVKSKEDDQK